MSKKIRIAIWICSRWAITGIRGATVEDFAHALTPDLPMIKLCFTKILILR